MQALDRIQRQCTPLLKARGFEKNGRDHVRLVGDGMSQVLFFAGPQLNLVPDTFSVQLGIYLPVVADADRVCAGRRHVKQHMCQIRGELTDVHGDPSTWPLDGNTSDIALTVQFRVKAEGLPFLEQFLTHRDVLRYFEEHGDLRFNNPGRAAFVAAVLYWKPGDAGAADRALAAAIAGDHAGFREHVREVSSRLGMPMPKSC